MELRIRNEGWWVICKNNVKTKNNVRLYAIFLVSLSLILCKL